MRVIGRQLAALALLGLGAAARAQSLDPTPETTPAIELDGSIGPGGDVPFENNTWTISDKLGKYNGSSLFHSFGRFDIPDTQTAEFIAEHGAPQRVFARVTWGERSDIEGTLRSSIPGADFYLINPAGVRFSLGAQIDVPGSFHASTAGTLHFEHGDFETSAADPLPLLTLGDPVAYGFLENRAAPIQIGGKRDGMEPTEVLDEPLSVDPEKTLALIAGDIEIYDGQRTVFQAPGARLALVAAGPGVEVPVGLTDFHPEQVSEGTPLGHVWIDASEIGASLPAGSLLVRGGSSRIDGSGLGVTHDGSELPKFGNAIDISVRGALEIIASSINAGTYSEVDAGDILLSAGSIAISGSYQVDSEVLGATVGSGRGSDILVSANSLSLSGGAQIRSWSAAPGPGGTIDIEVGTLVLKALVHTSNGAPSVVKGGAILSESAPLSDDGFAGPGGAIDITAGSIEASDTGYSLSGTLIGSRSVGPGGATAGAVDIHAGRIELSDGAQIFSSTSGPANAGSVSVTADSIALRGVELDAMGKNRRTALIEVRALEGSTGSAGTPLGESLASAERHVLGVTIDTRSLEVRDGAEVGSATLGRGAAGDVVIHASDSVVIASGPSNVQSRATATLSNNIIGDGGLVQITTPSLSLLDGGQITSATTGTGNAGDVDLQVGQLEIRGANAAAESGIFVQTLAAGLAAGGAAGAVTIHSAGDVALSDGGKILAETSNGGAAGIIDIDAGGRLLLDNGAISARATVDSTAASGSIDITAAQGVFLDNGSVIGSRSAGTEKAGTVIIRAGPRFEARGGSHVSTESTTGVAANAGGGVITILADDLVTLTDSFVDTSVQTGGSDGGDVNIDPELMVLNRSEIRANAVTGNGGNIRIVAGNFVFSSDSVVDASSERGINGTVVIQSPEANLAAERAQPAQQFLDAAGLLKTACGTGTGAGAASSFVVERVAGLPASPDGPLPAPLWDLLPASSAPLAGAPELAPSQRPFRIAGLAGGCQQREVVQ